MKMTWTKQLLFAVNSRIESVINNPYLFKVFREVYNNVEKNYDWQLLRKSVADIFRRTNYVKA